MRLVASSIVATRSSGGPSGSQAWVEAPEPAEGLEHQHSRQRTPLPFAPVRPAPPGFRRQPARLQHALRPAVGTLEQPPLRHLRAMHGLVEVLGRKVEIAGAELLDHPFDLVHRRPPPRRPPATAINNPLRAPSFVSIPQAAKMPLAHPQQIRRVNAAQLLLAMQQDRIRNPGHPNLRQHSISPAKTGQIGCHLFRTYHLLSTAAAQRP